MRASIGADAACRAAERATTEQRARIVALADGREETYEPLWLAIVDASHNVAYRLALNTLLAGVASFPAVQELLAPGPARDVVALGAAIASGDGAGAERVARGLLEVPKQPI
jgi:DNA-binding FadR family transcriptional regulator